jgi:hypothetical protein
MTKTFLCGLLCVLAVRAARSEQNVVVLLDDSGSMAAQMGGGSISKIDAAKEALLTVLRQVPDDANIGLLLLNGPSGSGEWIIPLGPVDRSRLENAIRRITTEHGTPLGEFMKVAADELLSFRAKHHYGTYRLLIVTDGEANDAALVDEYLPLIQQRNIQVDVIGVDMATDHSLATRVDSYRRADDAQALTEALTEVLAETAVAEHDDISASDSDYAMLRGLPDELALAMVHAVTTIDNMPLGESAGDEAISDEASRGGSRTQGAGSRPRSSGRRIAIVLICLLFVVAVLSKLVNRSRF